MPQERLKGFYAMTQLLLSSPIELPRLLFATQNSMDDYCAPDMLYGDLSAEVLRKQYHLGDISTHLDPYTYPDREQSARILLDEFRDLSDMFSFWGDYKSLTRAMISHMQYGNGAVFSSPLLDQAMAEHSSVLSSLKAILSALKNILTGKGTFYRIQLFMVYQMPLWNPLYPNSATFRINSTD